MNYTSTKEIFDKANNAKLQVIEYIKKNRYF